LDSRDFARFNAGAAHARDLEPTEPKLTEEGEPMTRGKILTTVLGIAGALLLGLSAGSNAASTQARRATTLMAPGFPRLPPPPPIVGYPPQIYMFGPPPGVVGPSFGLDRGFGDPAHRHDFRRFDRPSENPLDH
jgi:hypothetical protein